MKPNDLNTALYEKMATEQEKYRDWLKSQPSEEILHHIYEYTVREDIVMAMEQLEPVSYTHLPRAVQIMQRHKAVLHIGASAHLGGAA